MSADVGFKGAVHQRVQHFAALRSAQRALTPSVRDAEALFPPEEVREVLGYLRSLAHVGGGEGETQAEVDGQVLAPSDAAAIVKLDQHLWDVSSRILRALDVEEAERFSSDMGPSDLKGLRERAAKHPYRPPDRK